MKRIYIGLSVTALLAFVAAQGVKAYSGYKLDKAQARRARAEELAIVASDLLRTLELETEKKMSEHSLAEFKVNSLPVVDYFAAHKGVDIGVATRVLLGAKSRLRS